LTFGAACVVPLLLQACGRGASRAPGQHSTMTASECTATPGAARDTPAAVTLTIVADPAAAADAEATVRVEGELSRNDIQVSVAGGARLDLTRGVYEVRVTVKGYEPAIRRITVTAGCNVELVASLKR